MYVCGARVCVCREGEGSRYVSKEGYLDLNKI
jgi:hypothetical protein